MDKQVEAALAKWPNVPDCTGWLALDARGRWRIGEAKAGPRQQITHGAMIAFINRNYFAQDRYWVFQNGPQRVFVELEYTPYVWRLIPRATGQGWDLVTHTGEAMTPCAIWLDSDGRFLVEGRRDATGGTALGGSSAPVTKSAVVGVVHDHDTTMLSELLCDADGGALDDETLASLSSGEGDALPPVRLRWNTEPTPLLLPLQRIATAHVPSRFAFEPKPAVALRVDVDTRR